jgi:hypothetical protein
MSPDTPGGQAARIARLERDERESRERRDAYMRDLAAEHRRLWDHFEDERNRVTRLEERAEQRYTQLREDIGGCSGLVERAEGRLNEKIDGLRAEVRKTREGTLTQKVAYIAAAGTVLAAAIIGIAQVLSALGGH